MIVVVHVIEEELKAYAFQRHLAHFLKELLRGEFHPISLCPTLIFIQDHCADICMAMFIESAQNIPNSECVFLIFYVPALF